MINQWACALMCASHAEDGCCSYKDDARRVGDENDGDNYEALPHEGFWSTSMTQMA